MLLETIWNNELFPIASIPVIKHKWYWHVIYRVCDLFNNDGSMYTVFELKNIFSLECSFHEYDSVISMIKSVLKQTDTLEINYIMFPILPKPNTYLKSTKEARDMHTILVSQK